MRVLFEKRRIVPYVGRRGGIEARLLGDDASDALSLQVVVNGCPGKEVMNVWVVGGECRKGLVEKQGVLVCCGGMRVDDRL